MTDRTPIIAPGTLPGRARAIRKAHDRRTRLARESRAASPAGRARPETASRDEYRVLRSKPSNISLTPQSTRLDLPLVPPRQRPGHTQQHIHRQRRLTEDPPYQIRHERDQRPPRSARPGDRPPHRANEGRRLAPRDACQDTDAGAGRHPFRRNEQPDYLQIEMAGARVQRGSERSFYRIGADRASS